MCIRDRLEGADGVHSEREDHTPVLRVVSEGIPFVNVPPESECEEQGNPPRRGSPKEQSESLQKRSYFIQQGPERSGEDQPRAGKSSNGNRAHVDPIGRRERGHRDVYKREAIEDQRNQREIEHAAKQKHTQREEENRFTMICDAANQ